MRNCVIFGATSAIAMETAKLFAANGDSLLLVARNETHLDALKADLTTRGAVSVNHIVSDLADCKAHQALLEKISQIMPDYNTVLVAYGSLPNQEECEQSFETTERELNTNFISVVSLLTPIANRFAENNSGTIAVISSVAGDRGRQSNYVYGAAKGGLSLFLQGLRNRLFSRGVSVITIKPGFVDTPMTAGIKKNALFVTPDVVAKGIFKAINKKRDVVYLPCFWWGIMLVIKSIPEFFFKRQKSI